MEAPRCYRFELMPNAAERRKLDQMAGARRFVWNWGLERKVKHYRRTGRNLHRSELRKEMQQLKRRPETAWLQTVDSQLLQQALDDLHWAFRAFFARSSGFPRFKSKKDHAAGFRIPQRVRVENGRVRVPKIGWVRVRPSRRIAGRSGGARFKRDATGRWFVSIVSWFEPEPTKPIDRASMDAVGVDLGVSTFATLSNGILVANPGSTESRSGRLGAPIERYPESDEEAATVGDSGFGWRDCTAAPPVGGMISYTSSPSGSCGRTTSWSSRT